MLCGGYDIIIDKVYSVTNTNSKEVADNSTTTTKSVTSSNVEKDEDDSNKAN